MEPPIKNGVTGMKPNAGGRLPCHVPSICGRGWYAGRGVSILPWKRDMIDFGYERPAPICGCHCQSSEPATARRLIVRNPERQA